MTVVSFTYLFLTMLRALNPVGAAAVNFSRHIARSTNVQSSLGTVPVPFFPFISPQFLQTRDRSSKVIRAKRKIEATDEVYGKTGQAGAQAVKQNLRGSVFKMNMVSNFVVGMPVPTALDQLKFLNKRRAKVVSEAVKEASDLAKRYHGLKPEDLYVAGANVGRGTYMKRVWFRGRGRIDVKRKPQCHLTICVLEDTRIDHSWTREQRNKHFGNYKTRMEKGERKRQRQRQLGLRLV